MSCRHPDIVQRIDDSCLWCESLQEAVQREREDIKDAGRSLRPPEPVRGVLKAIARAYREGYFNAIDAYEKAIRARGEKETPLSTGAIELG